VREAHDRGVERELASPRRRVQTAEGELAIEIPQVRQAAETFASKLFPRTPKLLRTEPLKALVIGAFVWARRAHPQQLARDPATQRAARKQLHDPNHARRQRRAQAPRRAVRPVRTSRPAASVCAPANGSTAARCWAG
jgi:hypothetical protein